jgi:hypothetical protein
MSYNADFVKEQALYERELTQFMRLLHDLLIAGAELSGRSIEYILRHMETLGEGIGNFPTTHPIFPYIARSPNITHQTAREVMRLSHNNAAVREALLNNDVISDRERTFFALH